VASVKQQYDLGLEELANGRPAAAVAALKRSLALDEKFAPAHAALGRAFRDLERLEEARHCFARALEIDSALHQTRIELANSMAELGQLGPAVAHYQHAVESGAAAGWIYMRLGAVLWKMGSAEEAAEAFEKGISAGAESAEAYYNLGSAQLELGQFTKAESSAREALNRRAGFGEARALCAAALAAQGNVETGIRLLEDAPAAAGSNVAQKPNAALTLGMRLMSSKLFEPARRVLAKVESDPQARHLLAAVSGENPERPAEGYVRKLFDASAPTFDREVAGKLCYDIPREMVVALRAIDPGPWDVLDLGCGTGLVGVAIAPFGRRLVGVDIAPNMIEAARRRNVYTELLCADLSEALNSTFDVVTSADVFIYVGKLDEVVPAIRKALQPRGLFAFSVELVGNEQDYKLGVMGRYAHSAAYLRRLAAQSGFEIVTARDTTIRLEHRKPVAGLLSIWRARNAAA
jgi:predicted TPR repeat methyltransferase/Tfp pilus assembly protein PilF